MNNEEMHEIVYMRPAPQLEEVKFPKTKYIMLDISKFDYNSATECFTAVQQEIKKKEMNK